MRNGAVRLILTAIIAVVPVVLAQAADPQVERGKYLVQLGGCFDCHTPGYFFGHPDMTKYLGGSDVGFAIPGLGVFVAPNRRTRKPDWAHGRRSRSSPRSPRVRGRTGGYLPRSCPGRASPI